MNRRRILQPLFAGVLLALGFGILWALLVVFASVTADGMIRSQQIRKSIEVRADGTPLIRTYKIGINPTRTYQTLDGRPVLLSLSSPRDLGTLAGPTMLPAIEPGSGPSFGLDWRWRIQSYMDAGRHPPVFWYFVHDGRRDGGVHFVGYDAETKMPIGYIGLEGFREQLPPPEERFPIGSEALRRLGRVFGENHYITEPYYYEGYSQTRKLPGRFADWNVYLVSEGRLLEIDLHERSVRTLLESDGLCAVARVQLAMKPGATPHETHGGFNRQYLAVRTADQIFVLDSDGVQQQRFSIPAELRNDRFTFYDLGDDAAMLHLTRQDPMDYAVEHDFVWIDGEGNVTDEKSVTLKGTAWLDRPAVTMGVGAMAVPATACFTTALLVVSPWVSVFQGTFPSYSAAMATILPQSWVPLLAVNLLCVVLAIICYRRQKKFAQARVWPWVAFVFLFGLPGMVGYLAHQRWPVREACPKCKQPVPRDRDACAACDEPFPQPELKGIEVLV